MEKRKFRFVTPVSDEEALANPMFLPQICATILDSKQTNFIAVYEPDNRMRTVMIMHHNSEAEGKHILVKLQYAFFDGSKNGHLKEYSKTLE